MAAPCPSSAHLARCCTLTIQAKTINAGAYFRTIFTGQSAVLRAVPPTGPGPYSQFWTRVDGGPLQQHVLEAGTTDFPVALGPPFSVSGAHLLEVIIKSTSETIDRWNQQTTGVAFLSLSLDANATVQRPARKPKTVLIYGDSITEGVRTLGWVGIANDTDHNDAVRGLSFRVHFSKPAPVHPPFTMLACAQPRPQLCAKLATCTP